MRPRIRLAKTLIKIGEFLQNSAIMVMRPDDLVAFSRETYSRPHNVAGWGSSELIASGLYPQEKKLLDQIPFSKGKMLLLGVGGGREAIPMAKMGFEIMGVDFVPEMVEMARENLKQSGFTMNGAVQEISELTMPEGNFDLVWLSASMYSCVPTREKRIAMLARIRRFLAPGGFFVVQFSFIKENPNKIRNHWLYKSIAWLTFGNLSYEPGDTLRHRIEFIHEFANVRELRQEFSDGGFNTIYFEIFPEILAGGAVLQPV